MKIRIPQPWTCDVECLHCQAPLTVEESDFAVYTKEHPVYCEFVYVCMICNEENPVVAYGLAMPYDVRERIRHAHKAA